MTTGFLSLFFATFVLEDLALFSGIALVAQGKMTLTGAFAACFLGIAVGDIGLYIFGLLAGKFRHIADLNFFSKIQKKFSTVESQGFMSYAVFAARFLPGTRVATYTLAGFTDYSFLKFFILTLLSVFVWVLIAFQIGLSVQSYFSKHIVLVLLFAFISTYAVRLVIKKVSNQWQRKILMHSWRKWLSFEFWPPWLFYIPIVPRYIFLSFRYRSFVLPFYANPFIEHAGIIGESKWDFYKHLQSNVFSLKTQLIPITENRLQLIKNYLMQGFFQYPFILKPDKGQRGFAVRIIKNEFELNSYLATADFNLIIQEFCDWPFEAGIFYMRKPDQKKGQIFSITDKQFPFVVGDGKTKLGDLILQDERARIIATIYFTRFQRLVDSIPVENEKVFITNCGNHCQGAIFKNGNDLNSDALLSSIENLARQIPDFYFGRLDIRYLSPANLKDGNNFKIVEINGAGSEATHIWDPQTSLLQAYKVLFAQWGLLFEIGHQIKQKKLIQYKFNLLKFIKELLNLRQQEKKLAVSS